MSDPAEDYGDQPLYDDDDAEAWFQYWQDRLEEERLIGDQGEAAWERR